LKKTKFPLGITLGLIFLVALAATATIYSFFVTQDIDVSTEYQIYFDGSGVEDTVLSNWSITNATSNNVYETSHTIQLNDDAQTNYTVSFVVTNDSELSVMVLTTSGDTGSAITDLLLDPGVTETVYYYIQIKDKVSGNDTYAATIEVT
jgi:hypothetical protein